MIKRTKYLSKIVPFIDKPLIKALVGVRRSGKTVLLTQIKEHLLDNGISENQIIYINFESFAYRKYLDGTTLYNYIIGEQRKISKKLYLFFDEIQEILLLLHAHQELQSSADFLLQKSSSFINKLTEGMDWLSIQAFTM